MPEDPEYLSDSELHKLRTQSVPQGQFSPGSQVGGQKVVEPPGFFSRLGETLVSPIMGFGQGIESISKPGAMGVNAVVSAAENYAQHQDPTRAVLAETPVGSISEDVYNRNWRGLAGTGVGTAALFGLSPEVRSVGRDIAVGGWKGGTAPVEAHVPFLGTKKLPGSVAGAVTGGGAGWTAEHLVNAPHGTRVAGAVTGAAVPIIRGAYEGVKSGWRARHPWEGPDIAPGETRTPYRAPRAVREGYRNPPATGSQVSGPTYQVPKEEPSPLERITGETKTPAWRPRREDPGYRNPPSRVKPPEPALVPSTAMKHLLNAFQEMIKRQQPKD